MGNLYRIALYGTVLLGAIVIVLAAYAVLTRWLSERRQTRAARLRPRLLAAVEGFLDGRVTPGDAERELAADRKLALGVLLGVASARSREEQLRLRPLAARLGYERRQLQLLANGGPERRANAAVQLGYLGSDSAGPALFAALKDEQLDVRLAAAQALVQMQRSIAVVPILRALALPGRWPLQRVSELLVGFGERAIAPLRQLLLNRADGLPPAALAVAINVLGLLGARQAAMQVAGWLDHADPEIRVAAAKALGGMQEPDTVPALVKALRDETWEVRGMAAKSLGRLHDPGTIPALDRALADRAWSVRYNAAHALDELGGEGAGALRRALATQDDAFARDISRQMLEERHLAVAAESP
jgi:HEAT repeat protein